MKKIPVCKMLYAIFIHGMTGDQYTFDEIQDATGIDHLRTHRGSTQICQALSECRKRGVNWGRVCGHELFVCVKSPNKSRTQCKADPRAVEFV